MKAFDVRRAIAASGVVSTILAIYSGIPYLRSILAERTRPHQFSWLIFVIMNGMVTVSQLLAGGRWSVLISATFFAFSAAIFVLSLDRGSRDTSPYDRLLLGLSLFSIAMWIVTRSNVTAIWLTVVIDVSATVMTILKIRRDPNSEDPKPWAIAAAAYVFSCAALVQTPVGILYVRPIYGLVTDTLIVLATWWFGRRRLFMTGG